MEDWIIDWVLRAALFSLMFGMGLALTTGDFRRIVRLPGPVVAGTLLQLVAMPAIGYGLVLIFDLPALLAVGLVVAAACPGGMLSNTAVYYAGGNTALSITLTATATAVTLFTMPLWIRATLSHYPDIAEAVSIPGFGTAMELGGLTILPVALGMALRNKKPAFVRLERPLIGHRRHRGPSSYRPGRDVATRPADAGSGHKHRARAPVGRSRRGSGPGPSDRISATGAGRCHGLGRDLPKEYDAGICGCFDDLR